MDNSKDILKHLKPSLLFVWALLLSYVLSLLFNPRIIGMTLFHIAYLTLSLSLFTLINHKEIKKLLIKFRASIKEGYAVLMKKMLALGKILKQGIAELKTKLKSFIKVIRYKNKLYKQVIISAFEIVFQKYLNTFPFWSLVYFLFLLLLSYKLNDFLVVSLLKTQVLQYFTAAGAMIGGILAIVFSLNLFLMQSAAENFSYGFYKISARDKLQDLIFFFISLSVVMLFSASLFTQDYKTDSFYQDQSLGTLSLQGSIFLIGLILYLIHVLYRRVFRRMQPQSAIDQAKKSSILKLDKMGKVVKSVADIMASDPRSNPETSLEEYLAIGYQRVSPIPYLNERLSYLFDFHDKLISKDERTLALTVINALSDIIKKYFSLRSNSSVILPTEYLLATTSDSQSFLTPNLERLNFVGQNYMRNQDGVGISKVVHTIKSLCISASAIEYISGRHTDNPIFAQCKGYLDQLVDSIIQLHNDEGAFQAADAYEEIATAAIQKELYIELEGIYRTLDKLTSYAVGKRFESGLTAIFSTYAGIIQQIIIARWRAEHELENLLEHLQDTVILSFVLVRRGTLEDSRFAQTEIAKPYNKLSELIVTIANTVEQSTGDEEREWISTFHGSVHALRMSLRHISETINTADHILIWSFATIIQDIGISLLNLTTRDKWQTTKGQLTEETIAYIHQTKWFSAGATTIENNSSYDELIETVAKLGLKAIDVNLPNVAEHATRVLHSFALEMLQKQTDGSSSFTEPRIMLRACFIGIVALKNSQTAVVDALKSQIQQFQPQYEAKWFANAPVGIEDTYPRNLLKQEVEGLVGRVGEIHGLPDLDRSSKSITLAIVTQEDIEAFVAYVFD